eukprot:7601015-Pyramimonas_sp.AAC.1
MPAFPVSDWSLRRLRSVRRVSGIRNAAKPCRASEVAPSHPLDRSARSFTSIRSTRSLLLVRAPVALEIDK